jgi:hypothetical protein
MLAGRAFQFYNEGAVVFPPTYKYDVGKDTYDTSYVATSFHMSYTNTNDCEEKKRVSLHGATGSCGKDQTFDSSITMLQTCGFQTTAQCGLALSVRLALSTKFKKKRSDRTFMLNNGVLPMFSRHRHSQCV